MIKGVINQRVKGTTKGLPILHYAGMLMKLIDQFDNDFMILIDRRIADAHRLRPFDKIHSLTSILFMAYIAFCSSNKVQARTNKCLLLLEVNWGALFFGSDYPLLIPSLLSK
ncbi:MAG: hypothetical protein NV67_04195 [Gammaproteobacteria bacterium (ex Lamellibrachia satsuma)]|nr:MAG: hypothetical protein NV67_04195 [Gammaproteobacteria bacterium (ex Lamellibrachia satsuma)]